MVSKQDIERDGRFFINSLTLDDILRRVKIKKYKLDFVKLGLLRHSSKAINETIPYKFLNNPNDEKLRTEYAAYCNIPNAKFDNPDRSINCFNTLVNKFTREKYDICKGIIVVDQFNCIQEGLHRSCILYKKFGYKHKIPVLRIITKQTYFGIRSYFQMFLFIVRNFFRKK